MLPTSLKSQPAHLSACSCLGTFREKAHLLECSVGNSLITTLSMVLQICGSNLPGDPRAASLEPHPISRCPIFSPLPTVGSDVRGSSDAPKYDVEEYPPPISLGETAVVISYTPSLGAWQPSEVEVLDKTSSQVR